MKKIVEVTITKTIAVTIDESKFTDEFLHEFSETIIHIPTVEGHIKNLAALRALELIDGRGNEFIEGYGPAEEMGIEVERLNEEIESDFV